MKPARALQAGEKIYGKDILDLASLDIGVEIPACASTGGHGPLVEFKPANPAVAP